MKSAELRYVISIAVAICCAGAPRALARSDIFPGDAVIEDLELTADFLFELDGAVLDAAKILSTRRHVAYLVIAPSLEAPLMLSPRGKSVQTVQEQSLTRGDLGASLEADFTLEYLGEYDLQNGEMAFSLDDKTAKLKPRPPLLGHQSHVSLGERDPKLTCSAKASRTSA